MDVEVDAVEQRPGQARLVVADATRILVAVPRRVARIAAAAGVHRRDQLHAGGKRDVGVGAGDIDLPRLQRLAQRIEHRALELGQFV